MRKPFSGNFVQTQGFGENPALYASYGLKGHNGYDYALPTGTPVIAPHSGKIIEARNDSGYGNYIKIENDKEGSVLAHLKLFHVNVGDTVVEGQLIADSNNTGFSTGPHLHWGYYRFPRDRNNGYAGFIDQAPFITPPPVTDPCKIYKDDLSVKNRIIGERDTTIAALQKEIVTLKADKESAIAALQTLKDKIKSFASSL